MTRPEFAGILAYLAAGIGKTPEEATVAVYFDLLGDLDRDTLLAAARRVLLQHRWATFPSVAELREAAAETLRGEVTPLSGPEAWALAWRAVGRIDLDVEGSVERATRGLPPLVIAAMAAVGVPALVSPDSPVGVLRGHFLKAFESLQAREARLALLPPALRREVEAIGARPPQVASILHQIGHTPEAE